MTDLLDLAIQRSEEAIEARANVFEIMAKVHAAMELAGAESDDRTAYIDACVDSGAYDNALALSRSELRKIVG